MRNYAFFPERAACSLQSAVVEHGMGGASGEDDEDHDSHDHELHGEHDEQLLPPTQQTAVELIPDHNRISL